MWRKQRLRRADAYTYRVPMTVTGISTYQNGDTYGQCPRCLLSLDRDYQAYCDRCGQALDWSQWEEL